MAREKEPEKTGGESGVGRWMLTYLDMVTLLFGVFVIMYAMSNVNMTKAEKAMESIRSGFQGGTAPFTMPQRGGQSILETLSPAGSLRKTLYDTLRVLTRKELDKNIITISEDEKGIRITFSGNMFFESGSPRITGEMKSVLAKIAPVLGTISHPVVISGYTDDVPVHPEGAEQREFTDNWELAALRALNVLRFFEDRGVEPAKMSLESYGKYLPLTIGSLASQMENPGLREINRRVDILIVTGEKFAGKKVEQEQEWR